MLERMRVYLWFGTERAKIAMNLRAIYSNSKVLGNSIHCQEKRHKNVSHFKRFYSKNESADEQECDDSAIA